MPAQDLKITELDDIGEISNSDLIPIVDVSDTSMSPSGTTRKVTRENYLAEVMGVIATKATDTNLMHLTGNESSTGVKDFEAINVAGDINLTDAGMVAAIRSPGSNQLEIYEGQNMGILLTTDAYVQFRLTDTTPYFRVGGYIDVYGQTIGGVGNPESGDQAVNLDTLDTAMSTKVTYTTPPSSATDTGVAGQVAYDNTYFYVCIDTDTWKRVELSTW